MHGRSNRRLLLIKVPDFKKRIPFRRFILEPFPALSGGDRGRNGRRSAVYLRSGVLPEEEEEVASRQKPHHKQDAGSLLVGKENEHICISWSLVVNITGETFLTWQTKISLWTIDYRLNALTG